MDRVYEDVVGQLRSYGLSRLLSELGYRDPQPPVVVLAFVEFDKFLSPDGAKRLAPGNFASLLARNPDYLDATRGDWRRPVVIVTFGPGHNPDAVPDLVSFAAQLLGTSDADRPVYITENNISQLRLKSPERGSAVSGGLSQLTPGAMLSPPPKEELLSEEFRVGIGPESASNAVSFPPQPDVPYWQAWGSLDYPGYGPMLRRAVAEFDPDPLFVFVYVQDGKILVRNGNSAIVSPEPVVLGMNMQHSRDFQNADRGQLGRTVVLVAMSRNGAPLPDWYARALAEGLRRVGGPPRPVFVYDGYHQEAFHTDMVLDRLRSVTPEAHWRRAGDVPDVEHPGELVPRYEPDLPPSYASAGEVAAAVAAVDRQRAAGGSDAGRPARPGELSEIEIANVARRWSGEFEEAERVLSALPADWVADLQARARTILDSVWERPRERDSSSAMAVQGLWDRMAQRVAFRLHGDGRSESGAWADAAAMAVSYTHL